MSAQTAPFPFVPATCTTRKESCGSPNAAHAARIAPSPGFTPKRADCSSASSSRLGAPPELCACTLSMGEERYHNPPLSASHQAPRYEWLQATRSSIKMKP